MKTPSTPMTYIDALRPSLQQHARLYDWACITGFSLLIALSARIAVHLPFSPVPITGQTLTVLLTGALLGRRKGSLSLLLYLLEGGIGLPVFAGGRAGLIVLVGPSGGYLAGFVAAAYVAGLLAERGWDRRIISTLILMVIGNLIIYAFALPWLALYVGFSKVLYQGFYPFLAGDLVKITSATFLLPSAWKWLHSRPQ